MISAAGARMTRGRVAAIAMTPLPALVGVQVAAGGALRLVAVAGVGVVLVGSIAATAMRGRVKNYMAIELPVLLLLASQVNLVVRSEEQVAVGPDPSSGAGVFRLALTALAMLMAANALISLTSGVASARLSRPYRMYALYVGVVFAGAIFSVAPEVTAHRGVELSAALLVTAAALRSGGPAAMSRLETVLFGWVKALLVAVWIGVGVSPSLAIVPYPDSPIPYQIRGVFPSMASNTVGTVGMTVALWSLATLFGSERERIKSRLAYYAWAAFGFISLIASQYRTGYVAFAGGVAALLVLRKKKALVAVTVLVLVVTGAVGGESLVNTAQPYVLRGQTPQEAQRLSGRWYWWTQAIPVWQESPLLGNGLIAGTRFEVLAELTEKEIGNIHSTWMEALVGTGVLGTGLLAVFALTVWRRAVLDALRGSGRLVPAVLGSALLVRSFSGTTFEDSGDAALLLLIFALSLPPPASIGRKRREMGFLPHAQRITVGTPS